MDLQKDAEIMDMSLIIKQVCQQLGLMEVMQRGSGPERVRISGTEGGGGTSREEVELDPWALAPPALDMQQCCQSYSLQVVLTQKLGCSHYCVQALQGFGTAEVSL